MKAHTDSKSRRIAREEYENMREEIFRQCADEIMAQAIATVLWTLQTRYGWKRKRLWDFANALLDTRDLMCKPSKLHHKFSPLDCIKELKDKYGMDIKKLFKAKVEVQK